MDRMIHLDSVPLCKSRDTHLCVPQACDKCTRINPLIFRSAPVSITSLYLFIRRYYIMYYVLCVMYQVHARYIVYYYILLGYSCAPTVKYQNRLDNILYILYVIYYMCTCMSMSISNDPTPWVIHNANAIMQAVRQSDNHIPPLHASSSRSTLNAQRSHNPDQASGWRHQGEPLNRFLVFYYTYK